MENIINILKTEYGIKCLTITPQKGGWSASAYKVSDGVENYFLKAYEINRASTPKLTSMIDIYIPITIWLNQNTKLSHKLPVPVVTKAGNYKCQDNHAIYLLYEYIDGETIGDDELSNEQVAQISDMIAELHSFSSTQIPFDSLKIREDFSLPFLQPLKEHIVQNFEYLANDLKELLKGRIWSIEKLMQRAETLSRFLIKNKPKMVFCHTDLHNWNLMQSKNTLILIDWEGLKVAPPEADLMFLKEKPYYKYFLDVYKEKHLDFQVNSDAMEFYLARRMLEDTWELAEQLLFDSQNEESRSQTLKYLKALLDDMEL
ncbi:aminoglycoside phosphotransferase family protein [Clostridium sp. MSJ-11]|uniref:Aminoglycoside phosphotransferase family protein n=1 Tax=Clostridium mobile TaxID=2841512 RepID=A0ABS6EGC6_9CLOT|nr:aminoglycoside phosphotransferase family protein [Clostridium mobile]MBU5484244.1 aminoglycoside phosphotransferase family protein [Clostridium mobile]